MRDRPIRLAEVRETSPRLVAGLMTGTSMDGLDVALVRVPAGVPRSFELVASGSVPMPEAMRQGLAPQGEMSLAQAMRLDRALGEWLAAGLARVCDEAGHWPDLIGSHGQTVWHEHGVLTCQLGEPSFLAERFLCPVVSDFRRADIAAGGCGAPLVPIVDQWLLADSAAAVVALNIGGIANLTILPPGGGDELVPALGFDTGPGNMVMDGLVRRWSAGREGFDRDGRMAAAGSVRDNLLGDLLAHPFLSRPPPRSAGREQFGDGYVDELVARAGPSSDADWRNLLATAAELTLRPIAAAVAEHAVARFPVARLVISGGGADNAHLCRRLAQLVAPVPLVRADELGLSAAFKEAIAFALLASARIDEIPGNLPAVTGARARVLLGKITER